MELPVEESLMLIILLSHKVHVYSRCLTYKLTLNVRQHSEYRPQNTRVAKEAKLFQLTSVLENLLRLTRSGHIKAINIPTKEGNMV